eukprot:225143-Prymnesium_polylepis.2
MPSGTATSNSRPSGSAMRIMRLGGSSGHITSSTSSSAAVSGDAASMLSTASVPEGIGTGASSGSPATASIGASSAMSI